MGRSENNRKARFYRLTRDGRKQLQAETRELGTNRGHHRAILCRESGGSEMRTLRRFLRRLSSWATNAARRRTVAGGDRRTSRSADRRKYPRRFIAVEARRQAVLKFGAVEAMKEEYRDQRGLPLMETLIQDTRHALRRLRKAPAFTITTVLTLALGIGATTSIFTLVHAVLLKSLPVANPAELYRLGKEARCCYWGGYSQDKEFSIVSYDLYKYFQRQHQRLCGTGGVLGGGALFGVRRSGSAEAAQSYPGEFVSGNYFTMFGISAYAGRVLTAADDQPDAPPVAVMSYRLWQQKYGSDPSVIGSVFDLDDKPFTVVGITPPGFFGDTLRNTPPDFFLPLNTEPLAGGRLDTTPDTALAGLDRPHPAGSAGRIHRG